MNHHKYTKNHQRRTSALPPDGVSIDIWNKFVNIRAAKKKGRINDDELASMRTEGALVGMTLQEILLHCILKNWSTFMAHWFESEHGKPGSETPSVVTELPQPAPPAVPLTPEQLARNKAKATAVRDRFRSDLAREKLAQATSNQTH